ncbi:S1 family peptidase [Saccharomonospora xinjiangensis]|uniref:S1 family peptidase n=1 Tax=Saccharomonospora xinjiangensis TaxID=75294 RepID=UPI0010702BE7|nr:S1 family peptidase [Saccharomonospora xinjiangensis]QBQ60533.1 Alpha-lytic protease precursor [Saccharomonospora xinjiangensis]
MNRKNAARLIASVTLAAGTAVAFTLPATAAPAADAVVPTTAADPVVQAMQRDLGLTKQEAEQRLRSEAEAREVHETVSERLGSDFAGAHYDAERGTLVVGVTDAAEFSEVREAGATPRLVEHTVADLESAAEKLDAKESRAPESVTGWYVDIEANSVVVTTKPGTAGQAERFVSRAGVDADAVDVVESKESPRALMDIIGGNAYYMGSGGRCSVGFSVQGGFVTAGHCGTTGTTTSSPTGRFAGSSFPGNDYAFVQTGSGDTLRPWVNMYNGYARVVSGSSEAPVGSSICRSGSTTGWHCGTVEAKNQTVRYPQGTVYGLTRTNVCAEPGDSGGSFISGNQAQGMTSGGSGNCTYGGTTYFQPVNEVLNAYGLRLITG